MVALADAHSDQRACEIVDIAAELGIGASVITGGVAERVLFREFLADAVEQLRECVINQVLFLPDIFSVAAETGLERRSDLIDVLAHIRRELREHDAAVLDFTRPAFYPFE